MAFEMALNEFDILPVYCKASASMK